MSCEQNREVAGVYFIPPPGEDHSWRPPAGDALDKFWRAVAMELKVQPPKAKPAGQPKGKPAALIKGVLLIKGADGKIKQKFIDPAKYYTAVYDHDPTARFRGLVADE